MGSFVINPTCLNPQASNLLSPFSCHHPFILNRSLVTIFFTYNLEPITCSRFRLLLEILDFIFSSLLLYAKDFDGYVVLKNQATYQMEDFSIFGLKWQYEVALKNLEALRHA